MPDVVDDSAVSAMSFLDAFCALEDGTRRLSLVIDMVQAERKCLRALGTPMDDVEAADRILVGLLRFALRELQAAEAEQRAQFARVFATLHQVERRPVLPDGAE